MPDLPNVSGKNAIKIFESLGFKVVRQKGSHVVLRKENKGCVIPIHRELAIGTLRNIIKQAGITIEIFIDAYNNR